MKVTLELSMSLELSMMLGRKIDVHPFTRLDQLNALMLHMVAFPATASLTRKAAYSLVFAKILQTRPLSILWELFSISLGFGWLGLSTLGEGVSTGNKRSLKSSLFGWFSLSRIARTFSIDKNLSIFGGFSINRLVLGTVAPRTLPCPHHHLSLLCPHYL